MKEKLVKIFNIIVIIYVAITISMFNSNKSYALSDITDNPNDWKPQTTTTSSELYEKVGVILGVINVVGVLASVATLSVIGIKFMIGSVNEKAQYKQTLLPWLIGAFMVFSVTTIPNIIFELSNSELTMYYDNAEISQEKGKKDAKNWLEQQWKTNGEKEQQIKDKIAEIEKNLETSKAENNEDNENYYQKYLNELIQAQQDKIAKETTSSVTISKTSLILKIPTEQTHQLTATIYPTTSKESLSWNSSNSNVVTVIDGKVQAVGAGTAQIIARSGIKEAICVVEVEEEQVKTPIESGCFSYYYNVENKTISTEWTVKNYCDNTGTILEMGFIIDIPDWSLIEDLDKIPLIVKLHGGGGWSNEKLLSSFIPETRLGQEEQPAIVLYPCKTSSTNVAWKKYNEAVIGIVDWVINEYNIDENKISLAGFSRGGGGAWQIGAMNPDKFSCIVLIEPSMNGGQVIEWFNDTKINCPVWLFHGSVDKYNLRGTTDRIYQKGCSEDTKKKLTIDSNLVHSQKSVNILFDDYDLISWMIERDKSQDENFEF